MKVAELMVILAWGRYVCLGYIFHGAYLQRSSFNVPTPTSRRPLNHKFISTFSTFWFFFKSTFSIVFDVDVFRKKDFFVFRSVFQYPV